MVIELDVQVGENCPLPLARTFSALAEPKRISRARVTGPDGREHWCHVTGWSDAGPTPAYSVLVEDSGEGVAILVYGGDQGVRLRPVGSREPWDVHSPAQWGEPCLLLDKDAEVV